MHVWYVPNMSVHVLDEIEDALPSGGTISHLLWALLFLKVYGIEDTMHKPYRKWVMIVIGDPFSNICKYVVTVFLLPH